MNTDASTKLCNWHDDCGQTSRVVAFRDIWRRSSRYLIPWKKRRQFLECFWRMRTTYNGGSIGKGDCIWRWTGLGNLKKMCIGSWIIYDRASHSEHYQYKKSLALADWNINRLTRLYAEVIEGQCAHWYRTPAINYTQDMSVWEDRVSSGLTWPQPLQNRRWSLGACDNPSLVPEPIIVWA